MVQILITWCVRIHIWHSLTKGSILHTQHHPTVKPWVLWLQQFVGIGVRKVARTENGTGPTTWGIYITEWATLWTLASQACGALRRKSPPEGSAYYQLGACDLLLQELYDKGSTMQMLLHLNKNDITYQQSQQALSISPSLHSTANCPVWSTTVITS